MKLKIVELFAGMGAPHMALKKCGIDCEVVAISEIDKYASKMYNLIHGEANNLGDISKIDTLPECDFLHASSPCQSFSRCGKQDGLNGESGLILEFYRLMDNYYERKCLPKFISFENVPEMKTQFTSVYEDFVNRLNNWGYNVYSNILSANDFGSPTTRIRLFVIAIRKDIDDNSFSIPKIGVPCNSIKHLLDEENDTMKYRTGLVYHDFKNKKASYKGWLEIGVKKPTQSNRVLDEDKPCPTITHATQNVYLKSKTREDTFRAVTPHEYWKISGYSEEDWQKIKDAFSPSRIAKIVGNSIPIGPLETIYNNLKPLMKKIKY